MEQHIKIIGILHVIVGSIGLVLGLGLFLLLGGVGVLSGDTEALPILIIIGFFLLALLSALSLPELIGGWGLMNRKKWARFLVIFVSFLNLFSFPFGTILAVYSLTFLFKSEADDYFMQESYSYY